MNFIRLLRIKQWTKNLLIFTAFIFAGQWSDKQKILELIIAFISFSLTASSVYIFNDLFDVKQDRNHPIKRHRPIASGAVSPTQAIILGIIILLLAISLGGLFLPPIATWILVGYFLAMLLYSIRLKHILMLDVFIVAGGLTTRAVFGAAAIEVTVSDWLLICAFLISLMLALIKRRQEIVRVGIDANSSRISLQNAPPVAVWDQWITVVSGMTMLAYMLYTIDPETVQRVGSKNLIYSTPLVIYGLFRYTARVYTNEVCEDPTEAILQDKVIWVVVLIWLAIIVTVSLLH